jgi:hydroxymethylpyrimidine pyrophosphatase-like HAD family hydrolase
MTIAVDFDGTIVEHKYPSIGKEKAFAIDTLRSLASQGHRIILWTARDGKLLEDAIEFCRNRGLEFYAINSNYPPGALFGDSRDNPSKVIADVYIDDRNLGGIPEWTTIYQMVVHNETGQQHHHRHRHKKTLLQRLRSKFR